MRPSASQTGSRSVLFEPIVRHGLSVGVIGVGWSTPIASIDAKTSAVLSYLAAEAASAIERSDLLARLAVLARTDDLTGIPNRRAWDRELEHALSEPLPICVAILVTMWRYVPETRGQAKVPVDWSGMITLAQSRENPLQQPFAPKLRQEHTTDDDDVVTLSHDGRPSN